MKKIVVTQPMDLFPDQIDRLKKFGGVKIFSNLAKSYDDWLERCRDADIICSGKYGLKQRYQELRDVFISVPFVGVNWLDTNKLKEKNIVVSRSPGCNKIAVSEYIMGMMLTLLRDFPKYINATELSDGGLPSRKSGLAGKEVCVLGKGNVGSRVGALCEAFNMKVSYFNRGDNLLNKVKEADVVVNCLSSNPTTKNMLDEKFFSSMKKSSYFITVTSGSVNDIEAIIKALDNGILAGVGIDTGGIQVGNVKDPLYLKLQKHPKILVTPHIAYCTESTARNCNDMMIDNVEAWLKGKPINVVK